MARIAELVFKGNNRSAIRAMTEIADRSERTAATVRRSSRESSSSVEQIGKSAEKTRGMISGLTGAVGIGGLAFGIKDVVQAGEAWQLQQTRLQGALRNTGQYSAENVKLMNDAAERLSTRGGFGAAENVQALAQFVTATRSVSEAVKDQSIATDIARRTGKDYTTVVRAIMMAEQGRTTGLSRLGITLPKVTTAEDALRAARFNSRVSHDQLVASGAKLTASQWAQLRLTNQITPAMMAQAKASDAAASRQQALAALQSRYAGQTDRFSKSAPGQISNMQNAWKSLQERIGSGLLPVVANLVRGISSVVGWLDKHRVVLYALLAATAAVTGVLTTHALIAEVVKAKTYALAVAQRILGISGGEAAAGEEAATGATIGLGAAMDALPVLALITGLVLLVTHFKQVKEAAGAAWKWIKAAASDTFNWIKDHWPLIAGIILAPFTGGISIIVAVFHKQIIGAAQAVIKWISGAWGTLTNILTWPFRELIKVAEKAWGLIKDIGHIAGDILGTSGHGGLLHGFGLFHEGGIVKPKYLAAGGPSGTDTVPAWLTPGEGVLRAPVMRQLGPGAFNALNNGNLGALMPHITIEPGITVVRLGDREIARAVTQYALRRAARGPSSLSGGSLVTGATGQQG